MLSLKVRNGGVLAGQVSIDISGTLDGILSVSAPSMELTATRQLSEAAWNERYVREKESAMSAGGSLSDDNAGIGEPLFSFEKGYVNHVLRYQDAGEDPQHVLTTLHNVSGSEVGGELDLIPSKNIDVDNDNNTIVLAPAINTPNIPKLYNDVHVLTWRLYHCLNSISGRLQMYKPDMPVDGSVDSNGTVDRRISTMGRYLGTYRQYQTLVARWNHYAWSNSFYLVAVEANERVAITIGYTNLECHRDSVSYTLNISFVEGTEDTTYKSKLLTIYNQGTDSTLDSKYADIATTYYRNGQETGGSGHEGNSPDEMETLELTTEISTARGADHAMYSEQYHRNLVAVAPCIGIDREYSVQPGTPTVFRTLRVTGTWRVSGQTYTKTIECKIAAVAVASEDTTV